MAAPRLQTPDPPSAGRATYPHEGAWYFIHMSFDLLTTVEYGGCSAKLPAGKLAEALAGLPRIRHPDLLVDIETHDDAGVFRITETLALVQTVDFFPPICSDPFEFGEIAAANALSDVYAMGGLPLTAMNIAMFPQNRIPLEVLKEILAGGQSKVQEAGAVIVGGHTIDDYPPKYGLSVTGTIDPRRIITNTGARPGDMLVLTKPVGAGAIVAGQRMNMVDGTQYRAALDCMKQLNRRGGEIMRELGVRSATDITGFGLAGHALKMAKGSGVTLVIRCAEVPLLDGAYDLVDSGCIPGASFRNQEFVEPDCRFAPDLDYALRMLCCDAQTSGGLLMCVAPDAAERAIDMLRSGGHAKARCIGKVAEKGEKSLELA
jgi:selenide,water dikinase